MTRSKRPRPENSAGSLTPKAIAWSSGNRLRANERCSSLRSTKRNRKDRKHNKFFPGHFPHPGETRTELGQLTHAGRDVGVELSWPRGLFRIIDLSLLS